jgi:hypothetical protein
MNKNIESAIIFILMIVILLLVFIYIQVFAVNKDTKHVALEHFGIESYLIQDRDRSELSKFYINPHSEPYINIAVSYPSATPPVGLKFYVYNDQNKEVSYRESTLKETNDYKAIRLYFDNTNSKYYTVNYTLPENANNDDTIEVVFMEVRT